MEDNVMMVSPTSPAYTAAYDYAGDARWYNTLNLAFDLKRVRNGRLFVGTDRLVAPPYHTTGIYEMGMIGKIYKEFRIPGGYHHDEWEMENGDILILTQYLARGTVEDACVMVDRNTGEILKEWDHQDVLPVYPVGGSGSQDAHDWFHNNAVWYDKKTNSLTFSGRHQDIIINRDFETGKLNWIIGDRPAGRRICRSISSNRSAGTSTGSMSSTPAWCFQTAISCASTTATGAPKRRNTTWTRRITSPAV